MFKAELMDAIDKFAQKRKFIHFKPRLDLHQPWQDQQPRMLNYYFEYYFTVLCFHDLLMLNKIPEGIRWSWAKVVAEVVIADENLWQKGNKLWWPAGNLLIELMIQRKVRVTPFLRIRDILSFWKDKDVVKDENDFLGFPLEPAEALKSEIASTLYLYIQDPDKAARFSRSNS